MSFGRNTKEQNFTFMTKLLCNCPPLLLWLLTSSVLCCGQSFGLEQDFTKQVSLPDSVYKTLLKDENVKDTIEESKDAYSTTKSLKKQFFQAAEVNLNNDKLPDLVVKAQSYLTGSNITNYWIFKKTKKGYILVLKVGTHSLSILKNRTKGFKNIRIDGFSGQNTYRIYYRFDGNDYIYNWGKTKDLQ